MAFPSTTFNLPTSTVIDDNQGMLMGARIADDGQWRFPHNDTVPEKFKEAILKFEDKNFYYHPGVDIFAIGRAAYQNIKANKIVSGGSTITMQVVRLSRNGKKRSFSEKFLEIILALRLELLYSKDEILALYVSNAPFGGNVVGLDAAAWRYYHRNPNQLSWAEAATLAVLPNAPSLIFPGKNHEKLFKKRNHLLYRLYQDMCIDSLTYILSIQEPLPGKPLPLPQVAPHLLTRIAIEKPGLRVKTTIDRFIQEQVNGIINSHHNTLKYNDINNACALVIDVETGNVLAYVGNTQSVGNKFSNQVDIITAPRSTGSILKPILFAAALNDGLILPKTLLSDIPTDINGFSPENYSKQYLGVVPANKALSYSLNIPAVRLLRKYGVTPFHHLLQQLGMSTLDKPADYYGLSLILGGAEGSLWDISSIYANFSRTLNHFQMLEGRYNENDYRQSNIYFGEPLPKEKIVDFYRLRAASLYFTYEALKEVHRPTEEVNWQYFNGSQKVAWKTGTSFGNRDAWAVGTTPEYVVGVWVGNANGEGRPGLTGVGAAAPILFDIFDLLKKSEWFQPPYDEMERIAICRNSGMRATKKCEPVDTMLIPVSGLKTLPCKYHKLVHLDKTGKYQVISECEDVYNMQTKRWFVLPPVEEWYYRKSNPTYEKLPPFRKDCKPISTNPMEIIYPQPNATIYIPIELTGEKSKVVFKLAHRNALTTVFWHIDSEYLGSTKTIHEIAANISKGIHLLTVVDEKGNSLSLKFKVQSKK